MKDIALPIGSKVRIIGRDGEPLKDGTDVGTVTKQPNTRDDVYMVKFDDGRVAECRHEELERIDMW